MEDKKRKTVLEGNAFYELDIECLKRKREREEQASKKKQRHPPGNTFR